jgi:DNA-binding Lrp family transcriptional regulator
MRKLSLPEKKVLSLLEKNARLSASQIARKTNLSPEGVLKIIRRLISKRIILQFNTKLNRSSMGYKLMPVHIKLLRLNKEIKQEITDLIKKHDCCAWFAFFEGEYDLIMSFKIGTYEDMAEMDLLIRSMSKYILEKDISIVLYSFELNKNFINQNDSRKSFFTIKNEAGQLPLEKDELKLLELLKLNCRDKLINLSRKLGSTPRVIASQIKRLEKDKVITGFKTKINMANLGYQPCTALIALEDFKDENIQKFQNYCIYKKDISYVIRQIGKYDFEIDMNVQSTNEFYDLIDEIRDKFPFIRKITTLIPKMS